MGNMPVFHFTKAKTSGGSDAKLKAQLGVKKLLNEKTKHHPCEESDSYSLNTCKVVHAWKQRFKKMKTFYQEDFRCQIPGIDALDLALPVCDIFQKTNIDEPLGLIDLVNPSSDIVTKFNYSDKLKTDHLDYTLAKPPIGSELTSGLCQERCSSFSYSLALKNIGQRDELISEFVAISDLEFPTVSICDNHFKYGEISSDLNFPPPFPFVRDLSKVMINPETVYDKLFSFGGNVSFFINNYYFSITDMLFKCQIGGMDCKPPPTNGESQPQPQPMAVSAGWWISNLMAVSAGFWISNLMADSDKGTNFTCHTFYSNVTMSFKTESIDALDLALPVYDIFQKTNIDDPLGFIDLVNPSSDIVTKFNYIDKMNTDHLDNSLAKPPFGSELTSGLCQKHCFSFSYSLALKNIDQRNELMYDFDVRLYFGSNMVELWTRRETITFLSMLSNVGGMLGLLLGASVMATLTSLVQSCHAIWK
ncbi:hypothetical protein TCAL_14542 [Tigriopus californicus]|uniref:Uncharacterized protein n=1 Tax=Tigriopus californicus TaxID=6832 RepID=A0A553PAK6_TIGCA|nr:hypothetical protein TCAL_14542 [Tigriopus californicus]